MDKQTHDVAIGLVLLLAVLPVAAVAGQADERLLDGIPLRLIGPSSPSGRVWQVVGVPAEPKTFYVCTAQGGVWRTTNFGATLEQVFDEENGASCGAVAIAPSDAHQIWVADIAPLEQLEAALERRAFLFDVKPVVAYNLRHTYGVTIEELDGDLFFRGKNPPYGAVITYYLRNAAPGDLELTVSHGSGEILRTLAGPGEAGLHQVVWDLEPDADRVAPIDPSVRTAAERQRRRRVELGTYTVTLEVVGESLSRPIEVRAERDGIRWVLPRK